MSGGNTKSIEYVNDLDGDKRVRTQIDLIDGLPVFIAVSLEHDLHDGNWTRVACIDSAGGTMHIDVYKPDGKHDVRHKTLFHTDDLHLGVKWAQEHFNAEADEFVTKFRAHL